jgi:diguanylate cyclase (GGDEF)-like protein
MDIDHFKLVNDKHGHVAGDKTLIELTRLLLNLTPNGSICCRYGGEEFLVIIPNSELAAIQTLAEQIRQAVSINPFQYENEEIHITISLGVVQTNLTDSNLLAVLARADQALYRAKSAGRNCVSI